MSSFYLNRNTIYCQNEPRFNRFYSHDNLSNIIKGGACVINLDKYADIGIHWIALYANVITKIYFSSFRVKHIPKKKKKSSSKDLRTIITNIFRIEQYNSVMSLMLFLIC